MNQSFYFENQQPAAYLTRKGVRLSRFGNCVYLEKNTSFEIEIINPSDRPICAVIEIDGKSIGRDLVIDPKKIVTVNRWQNDKNKKLKFKSKKSKQDDMTVHVLKNASIRVSFHEKNIPNSQNSWTFSSTAPENIWKYSEDFNLIFGGTTVNTVFQEKEFNTYKTIPFYIDTVYIFPVIDDLIKTK